MYSIFVLFLFRIMEILPKNEGKKTNKQKNKQQTGAYGWMSDERASVLFSSCETLH